jgi:hypothetical protein
MFPSLPVRDAVPPLERPLWLRRTLSSLPAALSRGFLLVLIACYGPSLRNTHAQVRDDEIIANLAGGRVIVHAAKDVIVFAAIDQPVEANSIPPRVMNLDSSHVGVLFGAAEWRIPSDPKPVRLDLNFPHTGSGELRNQPQLGEAEPDLETLGVAFLERLRPLVAQLHHKLEYTSDDPLFEVVIIGYAPNDYGPEVWVAEYGIEQELLTTRGDYWQTRILRPRFTQLYPPEKHAPRTLVEVRYPRDAKGPTLSELIQGNDPRLVRLSSAEPRFSKVLESVNRGQAQKAVAVDAADFLRAAVPVLALDAWFVLGTIDEQRGFQWIVPPDEPMEKATEDKERPPDAPTLRRKPKP